MKQIKCFNYSQFLNQRNEFDIIRSKDGKRFTIGFVPTMGSLHNGHLSLIEKSIETCDVTVVSIFVNPAQFGPNEDFNSYPRNLENDIELLNRLNLGRTDGKCVDIVFCPETDKMYNMNGEACHLTWVNLDEIDTISEGQSRPGFFRGVLTIVTKLFNIVRPDRAFFGQKDGLQCIVIKKLIEDLSYQIDMVVCPTVREPDNLALSSRNIYLNDEQRKKAPILYSSLCEIKKLQEEGERDYDVLKHGAIKIIQKMPTIELLYISISDQRTGREFSGKIKVESVLQKLMVSIAAKIGDCRLIDNILI